MKNLIELIKEGNGSTRLYQSEGHNLNEVMNTCSLLDTNIYSYGLLSNQKGDFIEIIKFGEEN